jgi:photosystem II stability/assembly factor-like uncharacterized protein
MFRSRLVVASVILLSISTLRMSGQAGSPSQSNESDGYRDHPHDPTLTAQQSGTTNRLQAVSPVNSSVVWASGVGGTFVRTIDGGQTWQAGIVAGAETLQFRDVQGVSEDVAYLLSSGTGTDSRIYKTENGGQSWTLQFENQEPNAFYDCFAFWTPDRGITTSDSVNGVFPAILTRDGDTWDDIGSRLPPAQPGEASFAASGTCVATQGKSRAWIGTGGAAKARILATVDGGRSWNAYDTPIIQGTASSGIFSVDFRDALHGILGGGELATPTVISNTVARSADGGRTWILGGQTPFPGAIYGLSYVRELRRNDDQYDDSDRREHSGRNDDRRVVATGPAGAAWSPDEGSTWISLPGVQNFWAVAFASHEAGWLVGTDGRILKIGF